ncbi:MAG: PEP-CTERM system histidine kinase PrsK [Acidobacteriota bacterium]|jgi:putative PEP-CTERM system histidine kinase|nr:PEP-CTERM system histidine kinase PrsK [Acidobacteriota bacterium]
MEYIRYVEGIAFIGGAALGILIAATPRFGFGSRRMLLLLFPACLSAGVQAFGPAFSEPPHGGLHIASFALVVFAAAGGYSACRALQQQKTGGIYTFLPGIIAAALVAFLFFTAFDLGEIFISEGNYVVLGPAGYISAIFLLIISVVVLANTEQMFRHCSKSAIWELKFLFLGIVTIYSAIIYLSSRMLLYSGSLYPGDIHVLNILFLIACILIAVSWKRSSGKAYAGVSQSAFYSFITLLGVGAYLITTGVFARLIGSQLDNTVLPVEALVFIAAIIGLALLLLTTSLRHKARAWMRHNIFAGKYDYRQAWIEAAGLIRATDSQEVAASALAKIIQKSMGTADISVWVRRWNPNRLHLLSVTGVIEAAPGQEEEFDIAELLMDSAAPLSMKDLEIRENTAGIMEFMKRFRATLIVPLLSSNRIIGLVTVGKDPSGRKYGTEGREFLRVLAGHIAGEFHKSDLLASFVSAREDEAFRSFSAFVLHDLKNFASTLSYIAQNAPRHQHNPEFQKDAFQSVYETAEKMKRICNSLRTFSGTLAADKKMCDLNQIVRSVADALNAGLREHLKFDFAELPYAFADEAEVARVLQNLLLNAREAIADDGVIFVRTLNHGNKIDVVVEDNGAGMSADFIKEDLFVPFHTTKSSGLGIGLFHSKKIMEAHNGSISVTSEEGKGTEIVLTFPVGAAAETGRAATDN